MKNLLIFIIFVVVGTSLFANKQDINSSNKSVVTEQTLVASYDELPIKLYKNQIFAIKIKALTGSNPTNIKYTAINMQGLKPLNDKAVFVQSSDGSMQLTLLYKVVGSTVKTPTIQVNFEDGNQKDENVLDGKDYEAITIPAAPLFTGVAAQSMKITNHKIDKYDTSNNILAIEISAKLANLEDFKLKNISSQGANNLKSMKSDSVLFYYLVLPDKQDALEFQYLNTEKDQLQTVSLKLDLTKIEDKVSTQTDLSPKSHDKTMYVFIVVSLIATIFYAIYYFRREKIFLILIFAVIGAGFLFLFIPNEEAKIKKDCVVYLLPTESSTAFFKAQVESPVEKLKESDGFTKVKLNDGKIGWVRSDCVNKN